MSVKEKKFPLRFTSVLLLIVTVVCAVSVRSGQSRQYYDIPEALDERVAVVDGRELTVRDLMFYVAYEEQRVEQDARIYNPEDTGEYWRAYTNGSFIRSEARNAAMEMAIHDEIFYQIAQSQGVELDETEEQYLANSQYDFWSDLEEEGREKLGVDQESINETMRRIALAEKCQKLYAEIDGCSYESYSFGGEKYQNLLEEHEYEIIEENWNRVHVGSITVNH